MSALKSFGMGLVGMIVALLLWHVYTDHQLVDAIRRDIQQRQTAPPPTP